MQKIALIRYSTKAFPQILILQLHELSTFSTLSTRLCRLCWLCAKPGGSISIFYPLTSNLYYSPSPRAKEVLIGSAVRTGGYNWLCLSARFSSHTRSPFACAHRCTARSAWTTWVCFVPQAFVPKMEVAHDGEARDAFYSEYWHNNPPKVKSAHILHTAIMHKSP